MSEPPRQDGHTIHAGIVALRKAGHAVYRAREGFAIFDGEYITVHRLGKIIRDAFPALSQSPERSRRRKDDPLARRDGGLVTTKGT